jgi:hypothetical protein
MDLQQILVAINGATLVSVIGFGYRIIRFISRIELKTDLMWSDYERRVGVRIEKE